MITVYDRLTKSIPNEENNEFKNFINKNNAIKLTNQGTNIPVNEIERSKLESINQNKNQLQPYPATYLTMNNVKSHENSEEKHKLLVKIAIDLFKWGDSMSRRESYAQMYNLSNSDFDTIDKMLNNISSAKQIIGKKKGIAENVVLKLAKKLGVQKTVIDSEIDFNNDDYSTMLQKIGTTLVFGNDSTPEATKRELENIASEVLPYPQTNTMATEKISNDDTTKGVFESSKESTLSNYLSIAGAGIGSLLPSTVAGWGKLALGTIGTGLAIYGGKKLYDYYKKSKKREKDIELLKQQTEAFHMNKLDNNDSLNEKENAIQFILGLSPLEVDRYEKNLLSGQIKSNQRLLSTSDLIDLLQTKFGNNQTLIRIAYAQAQNDYYMSIRNKKQIPQKIINFLKIMNVKKCR